MIERATTLAVVAKAVVLHEEAMLAPREEPQPLVLHQSPQLLLLWLGSALVLVEPLVLHRHKVLAWGGSTCPPALQKSVVWSWQAALLLLLLLLLAPDLQALVAAL